MTSPSLFTSKVVQAKKNIRLVLVYDGTLYQGWQRQRVAPTIQAALEERIQTIIREPVKVMASGRTDAGVHALHQVCHFISGSRMAPESLQRALNSLLPPDIFVRRADYVPMDFHARYSARSKCYEYRLLNRKAPDPFRRFYIWHISTFLDFSKMQECLPVLLGRHDFSCFRASGSGNIDPVREMIRAELHRDEGGLLRFIFEADGFLRHMVRNIVGTIVEVGLGKRSFREFADILQSRNRQMAGVTAPPQGLFLQMVYY